MAASTKVFVISELLEAILQHADLKDLLLWQRVNTDFQKTIETSRFQRMLYFEINPDSSTTTSSFHFPVWNSFMQIFSSTPRFDQGSLFLDVDVDSLRKYDYPNASWKRMLLISEDVTTIDMCKYVPMGKMIFWGAWYDWSTTSAVTIGDLLKTQQCDLFVANSRTTKNERIRIRYVVASERLRRARLKRTRIDGVAVYVQRGYPS
ncbi:hypothetical protein P7C71_g2049, partial [Lecanoromycetidae sp. Uapishka_2]